MVRVDACLVEFRVAQQCSAHCFPEGLAGNAGTGEVSNRVRMK
jgi:hypothetical protein